MVDLTIGITAHSESITLHKTLLSVQRATKALAAASVTFEIIVQLDSPTADTVAYATRSNSLLTIPIMLQYSTFGDPGPARNNIVASANGKYITFIDGDDLMSRNWLIDAYQLLESHVQNNKPCTYVAHTELTVEFGDVDSVVIKQGEIDKTTDTLLSVYANRWNVALMIDRSFLIQHPYPTSPKGFGFEDWYINCLTIYNDFHNILVPKSALFIRRKMTNSVWLEQKSNYHILKATPLLSFANIRQLSTSNYLVSHYQPSANAGSRQVLKKFIGKNVLINKIVRKLYHLARISTYHTARRTIPEWLQSEWKQQHRVDKALFPNLSPDFYETITLEHYQTALLYKQIIDALTNDTYDYIIFLPWIIKGGADLFSINYANTIAQTNPHKNVLVITTTTTTSVWKNKLDERIGLIELGILTRGMNETVKIRLTEQLVENSKASHLHIINSEFAYSFISSHNAYIRESNKKIVVTSFSQSTDPTGRIFGYSHTHVPQVYDLASLITTDNEAVASMWVSEYGFDRSKVEVHNQPVILPDLPAQLPVANSITRILWAARLSPEKQPAIIAAIAKKLITQPIHIDMYGQIDEGFSTEFLKSLPPNVSYKGSYDGFASLQPSTYDIYLYTSLFDGMPNSVLEAGSYSLPIIASAVGGLPDLIQHQKNGLIVNDITNVDEYVEDIILLAKDKKHAKQLGIAMRSHLEKHFSDKSYKNAIINMLKETNYL